MIKKLTDNFSLAEMSLSAMAVRKGLINEPGETEVANLTILCGKVLEPIRAEIGCPITIISGYRSPTVNKLVGGKPNSQHMLGQAADTVPIGVDIENFYKHINKMVKGKRLIIDQCICEFSKWVHISFTAARENRNEFWRATKGMVDGKEKTIYTREYL